jgi:hypothetical protein
MRVVSDRAKAPPAAMRIKRSATTLCASNASMAVCDDTENQLFQIRNRLLIVPFPIRATLGVRRVSFPVVQSCNQESAHTFATRESGLRSPASEHYAADGAELRLGRAVVIHQQRRQRWLEAHFFGCSAFQSRSSFYSGSSGTRPCRVIR